MTTVTLTDQELEIVRHALSMVNDIEEDCAMENISEDLFPRPDNPTILTYDKAKVLREELDSVMNRRMHRHSAMRKFDIAINPDTGYSA